MSFNVPQRLPDFANQERRQYENWNHINRTSSRTSPFTYKDKPFYGGVHPARRRRWYTSKWFLGSVVVFCVLWCMHRLLPGTQQEFEEELYRHQRAGEGDWEARRERVKEVFQYSWNGYVDHAWGKDEYRPISGTGKNMIPDGRRLSFPKLTLMRRHGLGYY
jgi:Glycosyl hydrolase family 47